MLVTPLTPSNMEELRHQTTQDAALQQLMSYIRHGWPDGIRDQPPRLKQYYSVHKELTSCGVILKGDKLLVPPSLKAGYTSQLHGCLVGIDKCKCSPRDILYMKSVCDGIEKYVAHCATCNSYKSH